MIWLHSVTEKSSSYRKITTVKWMDNKGLIAQMNDTGDTIAGLECSHGSWNELASRKVLD